MNDEDAEVAAEVKRLLRSQNFQGDLVGDPNLEPDAPLVRSENPEDDPLLAIDINTYAEDQVVRIPLNPETIKDLQPEEKERILRDPSLVGEPPPSMVPSVQDPWTRYVPTLGRVTVSDEEREEYLRALLQEQRFEIPIHLTLGKGTPFVVTIRSQYASEKEIVALAVDKVTKDYPIRSLADNSSGMANMALALDYYLRLSIMTQVTRINGEPQEVFDARTEPNQFPESSPKVGELAAAVRTRFASVHQARFRLLVQALNTFHTKQLILEDAMVNRDFWQPAEAS